MESFKGHEKIQIIISTINALIPVEILDNFLIESIENCFGDDEIIFQDDKVSCYKAKEI